MGKRKKEEAAASASFTSFASCTKQVANKYPHRGCGGVGWGGVVAPYHEASSSECLFTVKGMDSLQE